MSDEEKVLEAFLEFLDCRIRELINSRLGAGSIEDAAETRAARELWIKLVKEGS